jgi:hypothetical protein
MEFHKIGTRSVADIFLLVSVLRPGSSALVHCKHFDLLAALFSAVFSARFPALLAELFPLAIEIHPVRDLLNQDREEEKND